MDRSASCCGSLRSESLRLNLRRKKGEILINRKKELSAFLCLLLALLLFSFSASAVLIPKRDDYGATWEMYRKEKKDSIDVLFFGSSLVYCNIVPSVIYDQTGCASYVMAGPSQSIPMTYRYLRQACRTQTPKAVFVEVTGMFYPDHDRSTKVNIGYMPWGKERLIPTFQEASSEERAGLLFPLYAYHDRWDKLTGEDLSRGLFGSGPDLLAGYTFVGEAKPVKLLEARDFDRQGDYSRNLEYIRKIAEFCRRREIRPVFFLASGAAPLGGGSLQELKQDFASLSLELLNCNEDFDLEQIDFSADFYDLQHFNCRGAEKYSRYIAGKLAGMGLGPTENADGELWKKRSAHFAALCRDGGKGLKAGGADGS